MMTIWKDLLRQLLTHRLSIVSSHWLWRMDRWKDVVQTSDFPPQEMFHNRYHPAQNHPPLMLLMDWPYVAHDNHSSMNVFPQHYPHTHHVWSI